MADGACVLSALAISKTPALSPELHPLGGGTSAGFFGALVIVRSYTSPVPGAVVGWCRVDVVLMVLLVAYRYVRAAPVAT